MIIVRETGTAVFDIKKKKQEYIILIPCFPMERLMKTYLDCYPCFLKQAVQAGRLVTEDETLIKRMVDEAALMIPRIPSTSTPPDIGAKIHKRIKEISGIDDPYKEVKEKNIRDALHLYPEMEKMVKDSDDSLLAAIKVAIAGNIIDFGTGNEFDLVEDIRRLVKSDLEINDYKAFKEKLSQAESILYLGDNAGESVFDRLLIEELKKPVVYVVREIPILNDITVEGAYASGLGRFAAAIISSGTTAPGVILSLCSDDFLERFNNADMIISKGQGNYEGLSDVNRSVFFLLKAKCDVIAVDLGVPRGSMILKGINLF